MWKTQFGKTTGGDKHNKSTIQESIQRTISTTPEISQREITTSHKLSKHPKLSSHLQRNNHSKLDAPPMPIRGLNGTPNAPAKQGLIT